MMSLMRSLLRSRPVSLDGGIALLRVTTGLLMMWHGVQKLPIDDGFLTMVVRMGLPYPLLMAWVAVLAEAVVGILLAAGLITRVAALTLMGPLAVAIFVYHRTHEFGHKELAVLYVLTSITILMTGPGGWSADRWLERRGAP